MLEEHRDYNLIDKSINNPEERMKTLLFRNNNYQEIGKMIKKLWEERRKILEKFKDRHKKNYRDFTRNSNIIQQRTKCESEPGPKKGGCSYLKQKQRCSTVGRG